MAFEYSLMYDFTRGNSNNVYKILFEIQTKNGFTHSKLYAFEFQQIKIDALKGRVLTYVNNEEGYIKIVFEPTETIQGNVALRRSDSRENFLNWKDLTNFLLSTERKITEDGKDIIAYYDFTVERGLIYKNYKENLNQLYDTYKEYFQKIQDLTQSIVKLRLRQKQLEMILGKNKFK